MSHPMLKKLLANPTVAQLQTRWQQLNGREQRMIGVLGVVLAIAILYFLIWQPSYQARLAAEQRLQGQQQQLAWVKQSLARYQALSKQTQQPGQVSGSVSQRVNQAADDNDISLARMQPRGDGLILSVDEAGFEQVLQFVSTLENDYQLMVSTLDIARLETPGQVRVRQLQVAEAP